MSDESRDPLGGLTRAQAEQAIAAKEGKLDLLERGHKDTIRGLKDEIRDLKKALKDAPEDTPNPGDNGVAVYAEGAEARGEVNQ